jgi:hypothetical protein
VVAKIIIAILFSFVSFIGVQSAAHFKEYLQNMRTAAQNCLIDFSKNNCNVASPSEVCVPIISCAIDNEGEVMFLIEAIFKATK